MSAKPNSPLFFAIGLFLTIPIMAFFCLMIGLCMIAAWPIIPIVGYFQRKEENNKEKKGQ